MSPLKENFNFKNVKKLKSQSEDESTKKTRLWALKKEKKAPLYLFAKYSFCEKICIRGVEIIINYIMLWNFYSLYGLNVYFINKFLLTVFR